MAANLCGTAFGYLKASVELHRRGIYGLFTATEIMPKFVRSNTFIKQHPLFKILGFK